MVYIKSASNFKNITRFKASVVKKVYAVLSKIKSYTHKIIHTSI